ncbi:ABC transporter ATP-binding protein [Aeromicrobium choanae]|uniref:Branched-chain amino acid transport system ATP-binding protein n=1 Tax=Aeromicrobium choanae TaxID=1736691 RepID=A0A1T4YWE1_9ACTN|nr:ATP-binding cassette domain-containing protein [Aeromicrobium choanae]SKB06114.1 branched-chain amino acid transport system ATP-binding protein [Aeromicrobium choanae]
MLLQLKEVDVELGGVSILRDISFGVDQGETLGIVGPNGAGKTTILNVISAVVPTVAGEVRFRGEPFGGVTPHRVRDHGIGRSLQSTQYFNDLTVLNLVSLGLLKNSVWGALRFTDHRRADDAESRAMAALDLLDLGGYAHRPLKELSSAVQKLADMARALAIGTELVLLDEPTSGVSASERGAISDALAEMRRLGRTIVLIDHDPGFVVANCDQLMAMNFGEVLRIGAPDEVMSSAEVKRSYLGQEAD